MANQARNDRELKQMLQQPLYEAVEYIVQKIWNENREVIRVEVYEKYSPTVYNRTGEFQESWDAQAAKTNKGDVLAQGSFYYNPNTMSRGSTDPSSSDYGQHVSIVSGDDMRAYLADIIYQGAYGSAWQNDAGVRDAWSALLRIVGKRKMRRWLKEGMQKAGVAGISRNKPIKVTYN